MTVSTKPRKSKAFGVGSLKHAARRLRVTHDGEARRDVAAILSGHADELKQLRAYRVPSWWTDRWRASCPSYARAAGKGVRDEFMRYAYEADAVYTRYARRFHLSGFIPCPFAWSNWFRSGVVAAVEVCAVEPPDHTADDLVAYTDQLDWAGIELGPWVVTPSYRRPDRSSLVWFK